MIQEISMEDAYPTATKKVRRLPRKSKKWHKKMGYTAHWTPFGIPYFVRTTGRVDLKNGTVEFYYMK